MANETRTGTQQHHPDTRRDFETGTVNPGPGMAGPLEGKGEHHAADAGARQSPQHEAEQTGRPASADDQKAGGCGSCGCG